MQSVISFLYEWILLKKSQLQYYNSKRDSVFQIQNINFLFDASVPLNAAYLAKNQKFVSL